MGTLAKLCLKVSMGDRHSQPLAMARSQPVTLMVTAFQFPKAIRSKVGSVFPQVH